MRRKAEVRVLRRLAKELFALHAQSSHIGRTDNNAVFETARHLDAMADRVEVKYDPAQLTVVPVPVTAEGVRSLAKILSDATMGRGR